MNRARRLARLLRILAVVIAEPGLNPLELSERAGVSERTLRRDLIQLRELGYVAVDLDAIVTVGGATSGYCAIGSTCEATSPASVMMIESTEVRRWVTDMLC